MLEGPRVTLMSDIVTGSSLFVGGGSALVGVAPRAITLAPSSESPHDVHDIPMPMLEALPVVLAVVFFAFVRVCRRWRPRSLE